MCVQLDMDERDISSASTRQLSLKLNTISPSALIITSARRRPDIDVLLNALNPNITVMFSPLEQEDKDAFGDAHYSVWVGGVFFIFLGPLQHLEQEEKWLESELTVGKLCARHVVVVSNEEWFNMSGKTPEEVVLDPWRRKILALMQDSNVQCIVSSASQEELFRSLKPQKELQPKLKQFSTFGFGQGNLRVLRVLSTRIVSDVYATLEELPGWFALEQEDTPLLFNADQTTNEAEKDHYSDISSEEDE